MGCINRSSYGELWTWMNEYSDHPGPQLSVRGTVEGGMHQPLKPDMPHQQRILDPLDQGIGLAPVSFLLQRKNPPVKSRVMPGQEPREIAHAALRGAGHTQRRRLDPRRLRGRGPPHRPTAHTEHQGRHRCNCSRVFHQVELNLCLGLARPSALPTPFAHELQVFFPSPKTNVPEPPRSPPRPRGMTDLPYSSARNRPSGRGAMFPRAMM